MTDSDTGPRTGTVRRELASTDGKRQPAVKQIREQIIEIVSDSGEGAQTAGQMFAKVSARSGNGVWTVEIIPAEIEPPPRSRTGASGIRIRVGAGEVTNAGDRADIVVAFNEQVLYSRIDQNALHAGTQIFLENKWAKDRVPEVREQYAAAVQDFRERGYIVHEVAMEEECLKFVDDPRRGKNMWVVGMLCALCQRDHTIIEDLIIRRFKRKGQAVIDQNLALLHSGNDWAQSNLETFYEIPAPPLDHERVVMNGNEALAFGVLAAGIEVCAMYPITPATSASHFLAKTIQKAGGFLHQAEDEIAAIGFAIGASYAGKTAVTITSGPGLALKTEFIALAVAAEIPLVIVDVQRGGPSTGLPTKVEQGDLLAVLYGQPGDAPKIVIAPSTIEECFQFMITARQLAESFRGPVIVLTDANLATGVQPFPRPKLSEEWLAPPIDQSPWDSSVPPYDWNPDTGLSERPIPGQPGGEYVLTGLTHDRRSKVAYESGINQEAMKLRSRKLAALQKSLRPPEINGEDHGDLLIVGWGSTRGAIEEALERVRARGQKVSSIHLRFLSPLEPGLKAIFSRFRKVMTIEINFGDELGHELIDEETRRYPQLAWLLRARTLVDVDAWSRVPGYPLQPGTIADVIQGQLDLLSNSRDGDH